MKILTRTLPRDHRLFLISDTHEGVLLKHRHGFEKMVQMVLDDAGAYVCHLGDLAEAITVDDDRYCRETVDPQTPTPILQYRAVVEELKPIAHRLLTVLTGNHDWKLASKFGDFVKDFVCKELNQKEDIYGTYSSKLIVRDKKGRLQYKAFLFHGAGSLNSVADDPVRREANIQLQLKRKLYRKAGDTILMACAHSHKLLIKPPINELYLVDDGNTVKQKYTGISREPDYIHPDLRWYASTGCFYKLYEMGVSGYAERYGCDPNELGFIVVHVEDGIITKIEKEILD